ncbi:MULTISPECIES: stress protein [Bacillus]|uniref:stress protein n=1 Tax=Bacillus TaxID=1386 RepID=UPI0035A2EFE2
MKAAGVDAGLNVDVDVLGISDRIAEAVKSNQNRTGWVKNVMETTFYASGQKYNVMVFNLNQEYEDRFNGVQFYGSAVYDGITYGIWVFEDGSFDNKGDGGWINWAFRGWFDRDNQHIEFHRP